MPDSPTTTEYRAEYPTAVNHGTGSAASPPRAAVRVVRWVGGTLAALTVAATATTVVSVFAREHETTEFAIDPSITEVVIDSGTGDVRGHQAGAGEASRVREHAGWSFRRPTFTHRVEGTVLHVESRCSRVNFGLGCSVDLDLVVPAGARLVVGADTGDVDLTGLSGDVSVRADTGDISLGNVAASHVVATSDTGDVTVATTTAAVAVTATADTGDVRVRAAAAPGSVTADSDTGDVTVEVPGGTPYAVSGSTDVGDRRISVATDPSAPRRIEASSSVGNVRVRPIG